MVPKKRSFEQNNSNKRWGYICVATLYQNQMAIIRQY